MTVVDSVQRHRRILGAVLTGYVVALVLVLGWPTPVDAGIDGTLFRLLGWLHGLGLPRWIGYDQVEFAANIVLFTPLGLLLALELRGRPWWAAALAGCGLSVLAELAQYVLRPDRFATALDVVANTSGAVVGAAIAVILSRRTRPGPRERIGAQAHPPRVGRR